MLTEFEIKNHENYWKKSERICVDLERITFIGEVKTDIWEICSGGSLFFKAEYESIDFNSYI